MNTTATMIKNLQHPAIEKWLAINEKQIDALQKQGGITFISSFIPGFTKINSGLLQAVKFRLANPSFYPIIILSFHAKDELIQSDNFGIFSIYATEYLQLPVSDRTLLGAINICKIKYPKGEFSIPEHEWKPFSTNACKQMLSAILSQLKHGNQLDFVNNVTGPLRAACVASLSFPEMQGQVKKQLQNVQCFIMKEEISELMTLASKGADINDEFLLTVSNFSLQLSKMASFSCNANDEIKQLIFIIDNLNATWTKIKAT